MIAPAKCPASGGQPGAPRPDGQSSIRRRRRLQPGPPRRSKMSLTPRQDMMHFVHHQRKVARIGVSSPQGSSAENDAEQRRRISRPLASVGGRPEPLRRRSRKMCSEPVFGKPPAPSESRGRTYWSAKRAASICFQPTRNAKRFACTPSPAPMVRDARLDQVRRARAVPKRSRSGAASSCAAEMCGGVHLRRGAERLAPARGAWTCSPAPP